MQKYTQCQSLDYQKSLQECGNNQEMLRAKLKNFELYSLNESLLKLNKTYILQNLSDVKREAQLLANDADQIGAIKFRNLCKELCNIIDAQAKEEQIRQKLIQVICEAKILQQDISNLTYVNKRDAQYDQYVYVLTEQSTTQKSETDQKVITEESCCKIF